MANRTEIWIRWAKRKIRSAGSWLASPPTSKQSDWLHSVLLFLEHNIVILPAGIIGSIVALLFPPVFTVLGVLFLLGLHRSKAVSGKSRLTQVLAYIILAIVAFSGLYSLSLLVQRKLADSNTALAKLVASFVPDRSNTNTPRVQEAPQKAALPSGANPAHGSAPSLSVDIEQLELSGPDTMIGHYYTKDRAAPDNKTQDILIPVDVAMFIRIINANTLPLNIQKYTVEFQRRIDGKWMSLCKVGSYPDSVFTILGNFSRAYQLNVGRVELNRLITFRTLRLGDPPVRGFAYFKFPDKSVFDDWQTSQPILFKITIRTSDDRVITVGPMNQEKNPVRPPEVDYLGSPQDLSGLMVIPRFSNWPPCDP